VRVGCDATLAVEHVATWTAWLRVREELLR
jgi:hypothetical protein